MTQRLAVPTIVLLASLGIGAQERRGDERQAHEGDVPRWTTLTSLKSREVGLQVPRGLHPEVPAQDAVWRNCGGTWGGVPRAGESRRRAGLRRGTDGGSRAHDDLDPAEVRGVAGGGIHQGKSAIHLARVYGERKRNFVGQHFWARGYFVSTVGRDEQVIREYIRNQEQEDKRLDQIRSFRVRRARLPSVAPGRLGPRSCPR